MPYTQKTIGAFFEEQVRRLPDNEFIVYPDRNLRWSYAEFNQRVDNLAKGLLATGIGRGDHVGIWSLGHSKKSFPFGCGDTHGMCHRIPGCLPLP